MNRENFKAYIFLSLTIFFWAGNAIVAKKFSTQIPPLFLNWARWTIAGLILFFFTYKHFNKNLKIYKENFIKLSILGLLSVGLFNSILYYSSLTTSAINITLLNTPIPIVTVFIWSVIERKMVSWQSFFGLTIAFLGTLLVISKASLTFLLNLTFSEGDLWMLLAVIFWGLYTVLLKTWSKSHAQLSSVNLLFILILSGWIFSTLFTFLHGDFFTYQFRKSHLIPFAYVGIFPSIISFFCWITGVKILGSNKASFFIYLMPLFGVLLGFFFLNESLQVYHALGMIMILFGFYFISKYH